MNRLIVLPTSFIFDELYQNLNSIDCLELQVGDWAEAALWCCQVEDAGEYAERSDRVVGDFCHEATQIGAGENTTQFFGGLLYRFCDQLRQIFTSMGLQFSDKNHTYHLRLVDTRHCMIIESMPI